jgi:hypothetical protein
MANWINYEVSEEEWKLNWKQHVEIIQQLKNEYGFSINLIIYNLDFLLKGERNYPIKM